MKVLDNMGKIAIGLVGISLALTWTGILDIEVTGYFFGIGIVLLIIYSMGDWAKELLQNKNQTLVIILIMVIVVLIGITLNRVEPEENIVESDEKIKQESKPLLTPELEKIKQESKPLLTPELEKIASDYMVSAFGDLNRYDNVSTGKGIFIEKMTKAINIYETKDKSKFTKEQYRSLILLYHNRLIHYSDWSQSKEIEADYRKIFEYEDLVNKKPPISKH